MNERSESFVIEIGADNDKESGLRSGCTAALGPGGRSDSEVFGN